MANGKIYKFPIKLFRYSFMTQIVKIHPGLLSHLWEYGNISDYPRYPCKPDTREFHGYKF